MVVFLRFSPSGLEEVFGDLFYLYPGFCRLFAPARLYALTVSISYPWVIVADHVPVKSCNGVVIFPSHLQ